ncbi:MAG: Resolvase domain protein [Capsulimonas sp.]|nr:Resolvase domain protein [Capsulimonas sp.]
MNKRAVLYLRVSTSEQLAGTSIDGQKSSCLAMAAVEGLQVVGIYSEDASGALFTARPALMEALAVIERGEADTLIALKIDRLGRSVRVIRDVIDRILAAGGTVQTSDYKLDGSPMGRMMLTLLSGFSELERDTIRERTKGGSLRRAQSGIQPQRSRTAFGYRVKTAQDGAQGLYPDVHVGGYVLTDDAPVMAEAFRRYDEGASLRAVAKWLQATCPPSIGTTWYASTLRGLLSNPIFKGQASYGRHRKITKEDGAVTRSKMILTGNETVIPCPAIVDEALWDRVQVRLSEAQKVFGGNPKRMHLLSGLLRCPTCGRSMNGSRRKIGNASYHTYACPHSRPSRTVTGIVCNNKVLDGHTAEPVILRGIADVASRPEVLREALEAYRREEAATFDPAAIVKTEAALRALDAKETATVEAQVQGIQAGANPNVYTSAFAKIAEERQTLLERLAALEAQQKRSGSERQDDAYIVAAVLRDADMALSCEFLTEAERHNLLARVVEKVVPEEVDGETGYRVFLRSNTETVHITQPMRQPVAL